MELLPEAWRVLSDLSEPELLASRPHVVQALQQAQCVEINMGTTGAHGDMRLPNVAVHLANNGMSGSWILIGLEGQKSIHTLHS